MNIQFGELEFCDGFYRMKAGKDAYFCFDKKFEGDKEKVLYSVAYFLEANRLLYPPQKPGNDYTLYLLKNGSFSKYSGVNSQLIFPTRQIEVTTAIPMLAEICPN